MHAPFHGNESRGAIKYFLRVLLEIGWDQHASWLKIREKFMRKKCFAQMMILVDGGSRVQQYIGESPIVGKLEIFAFWNGLAASEGGGLPKGGIPMVD